MKATVKTGLYVVAAVTGVFATWVGLVGAIVLFYKHIGVIH